MNLSSHSKYNFLTLCALFSLCVNVMMMMAFTDDDESAREFFVFAIVCVRDCKRFFHGKF